MRGTAHHTIGPFFPREFVLDHQSDLTRVPGRPEVARGLPLELVGSVTDGRGRPVVNAIVELYQADAAGRFGGAMDPGFGGWGRARTDALGGYRFVTIKPGPYRALRHGSWIRPPHFTLLVLGSGIMRPLVTEAFFPGEDGNATDRQLAAVPARLRSRLLLQRLGDAPPLRYRFDLVLQGARETPFIEIASL